MKKSLSILVAISFFIFFPPLSGVASHQFSDLSTTNQYHTAVSFLVDDGAITGYPDGTFRPGRSINRVESLKILFKGHGIEDSIFGTPSATETGGFSDTVAGQWYIKYILYAKVAGFAQGYLDGTFRPTNQVNLAEALKLLFNVFQINVPNVTSATSLPNDVKASDWFSKYVAFGIEKNIIAKDAKGNVNPGVGLSRGAVAEMVYRLRYITDNNLGVFPTSGSISNASTIAFSVTSPLKGIVSRVSPLSQSFLFGTPDRGFINVQASDSTAYFGASNERITLSSLIPGSYVEIAGVLSVGAKTFATTTVHLNIMGLANDPNFVYPIAIEDNMFSSSSIKIYAKYLSASRPVRVRFTNLSTIPHEVASDPHPAHTDLPGLVSDVLRQNDTFEYSFTNAGTFSYHCHIHPSMHGTITIEIPQ